MKAAEWVEEGMPLGVSFVLTRLVYRCICADVDAACCTGARAVTMAVEHYREQCGAEEAEYLEMDDYLGAFWRMPGRECLYVAWMWERPALLWVGARVCMQ